MNFVSAQIQRAISDAISNQVLPQIQNALKAGSGHVAQKGWNVPAEIPEYIAEDYCNEKIRSNSRSEFSRNRVQDEFTDQAYDSCIEGKQSLLFKNVFHILHFLLVDQRLNNLKENINIWRSSSTVHAVTYKRFFFKKNIDGTFSYFDML